MFDTVDYDPALELSLLRRTDNGPKPEDGPQDDVPQTPFLPGDEDDPELQKYMRMAAPLGVTPLYDLTPKLMVAKAKSQLGKHEDSHGKTPYGIYYGDLVHDSGFDAAAWCDMFLAWVTAQVAGTDGFDVCGRFAFTPWHGQWFKDKKHFDRTIEVGGFAFYSWSKSRSIGDIDHVEIIEQKVSSSQFYAVGGNVSNAVKRTLRSTAYLVGVGHWVPMVPNKPAPKKLITTSDWYM